MGIIGMPVTVGQKSQETLIIPDDLDYVLVAGSDKLSIYGFAKYLTSLLNRPVGAVHTLMTVDAINTYVEQFTGKFKKGLITFYARRKVNLPNPIDIIPDSLKSASKLIVWFELYTTTPKILKGDSDFCRVILSAWEKRMGEETA